MKRNNPDPRTARSSIRIRRWLLMGLGVLILAGAGVAWRLSRAIPPEILADVKSLVGARNAEHPVEYYLENRYGSLEDPAVRREVFLDFFNVDHIKALNFIVNHSPPDKRTTNMLAMAHWIGDFRRGLNAEDKAILKEVFESGEGRVMIQQATSQYMGQDVYYRTANRPVINELMTTLTTIKSPAR